MNILAKMIWLTLFAALLPLSACEQVGNIGSGDTSAQADESSSQRPGRESHDGDRGDEAQSQHDDHADEEKHAEGHASDNKDGEREIRLTQTQRSRLDIKVQAAQSGVASMVLEVPATVRFDADRVARLGPLLQAKVVSVRKDLGDTVSKGETVAIFDSVDLGRAKARYLTDQARYGAALAEYRRDQKLAEQQITSQAELLQSKSEFLQAKAERDGTRAELALYGLSGGQIDAIASDSATPLSRYNLAAPIAGVIPAPRSGAWADRIGRGNAHPDRQHRADVVDAGNQRSRRGSS